ncbi:MAG: imidazole glycerol phosphate synthase subunit HisH [Candidatus Omnitrophota bacterium]
MPDKFLSKVSIIDYGMGNLFSVKQACEHAGINALVTADKSIIESSDALILPGVGAFGDAMSFLEKLDLISSIKNFISTGKPFLGICLGLQLLMDESEEFGVHKGLGIIPGKVIKFPEQDNDGSRNKIPQVGWNRIIKNPSLPRGGWANTPLRDIKDGEFMYFVHSFYVVPVQKESVLSLTRYGQTEYCSSFLFRNIFAVQFHPEKSSLEGIKIYRNWAESFITRGLDG